MTSWILRVVWPVHDDAMYDAEAITAAWFEVPGFAEEHQVTLTDRPRMKVVVLGAGQQQELRATRAVVCEAPVIRRTAPSQNAKAA